MQILSFEKYKLLLEAEGDPAAPAETPAPAEPAAPVETPAPAEPTAPATPEAPVVSDPLGSLSLPPAPNAAPAPTGGGTLKIVFIDEDEPWHSQYSDGGGVKRFKEYEFAQTDLDKWITDSKLDAKKDAIVQAVSGKGSIDNDTFKKLKSALSSGKFGKDRGDVDVDFDEKKIPSTSKLDLIFVKSA